MKTIIAACLLLTLTGLISCDDEPVSKPDNFSGSWSYESNGFSFSFTVTREHGIYNTSNQEVIHPNIPEAEAHNCQVRMYDVSTTNIEQIEIESRGATQYSIYLFDVDLQDDGNLLINELVLNMPSESEVVLEDQVLVRQ